MSRRRGTFHARRHHVDADPIEIGFFIAGAILVAVIVAACIMSVMAGYMR